MEYQHRFLVENTQNHKEVVCVVIWYFIRFRAPIDVQLIRDFALVLCRDLCHANLIWLWVCSDMLRKLKLSSVVNKIKLTQKIPFSS
jgi:hypothetical protein